VIGGRGFADSPGQEAPRVRAVRGMRTGVNDTIGPDLPKTARTPAAVVPASSAPDCTDSPSAETFTLCSCSDAEDGLFPRSLSGAVPRSPSPCPPDARDFCSASTLRIRNVVFRLISGVSAFVSFFIPGTTIRNTLPRVKSLFPVLVRIVVLFLHLKTYCFSICMFFSMLFREFSIHIVGWFSYEKCRFHGILQ